MCKNKNGPKKDWLFQPTYNPPWPICKSTFYKIPSRKSNFELKTKNHLAHLKKNNHGILPAISCLVLGFHPTPKVPIFPPPSWSHPGPIPFIRDPGPNPNPMILPHVLELNGSKKLPNLSGGISCWVKKGHLLARWWYAGKSRPECMFIICLFFLFLRSMEVVDWGGSNVLEEPLLGQCKKQQEDNHIDV